MSDSSPIQKGLFALILLLHIATLWTALSQQSYLTDDSIQYLTLSDNLSQEGVFSQSYLPPFVPDLQRTPGYPVFLLILRNSPFLVLLLQHLLVFLSGWTLFKILICYFPKKLAHWGALFWLLQPYPILFASLFLSETLFIFLLLSTFRYYLLYFSHKKPLSLAMAFLFLSLAAYVRPIAFPLFFLALVPLLWHFLKSPKQFNFRLIPALLVFPLLISPWMLRNHSISGEANFNTMGNIGMIHGRLGGMESQRQGLAATEHSWFMTGDSIVAHEIGLENLKHYYSEKQSHETELYPAKVSWITLSYFFAHPLDAITFELRSFGQMLSGVGWGWSKKIYGNKGMAWILAGLQGLLNLIMFLSFLWAIFRIRKWDSLLWTAGICIGAILLISAAVWADGRYRMVIDPLLVLFVVYFLAEKGQQIGLFKEGE